MNQNVSQYILKKQIAYFAALNFMELPHFIFVIVYLWSFQIHKFESSLSARVMFVANTWHVLRGVVLPIVRTVLEPQLFI